MNTARRPNGSAPLPIRGVRVPDSRWDAAKAQASARGETLSSAVNQFLDLYGQGRIDLNDLPVTRRKAG